MHSGINVPDVSLFCSSDWRTRFLGNVSMFLAASRKMAIAVRASDLALTFISLWKHTECAKEVFVNSQCIQWLYKTKRVTMGWTCSSNLGRLNMHTKFWIGKAFGKWSRVWLGMWSKDMKWVLREIFCDFQRSTGEVRGNVQRRFFVLSVLYRGPGYLSRYSDSLRAGTSDDRIPVGWRDFPYTSRPALGPTEPHKLGTGSFPGGKVAGAWRWPPTSI